MTDIDVVAPSYAGTQPTQTPPESDAYGAGEQAGEELLELAPADIKHGEAGEIEFVLSEFSGDVRAHLERAADDPEFAAGLVETLGPEGYSRLVAATDRTALLDGLGGTEKGETATELLSLLGQTLGSATRMPGGPIDAEFVGRITENDGFKTDDELDPELAAILLNEGDYTPETAAMLAGHVFLESDPPQVYDRPDGYIDTPAHRQPLLTPAGHNVEAGNVGAWATATHGLLRNGGASEVLGLRDDNGEPVVAQRLLDPNVVEGPTVMPALIGAILDTPRINLASNPNDSAALAAVESLVLATHDRYGDVGEWASEPLANLYMDHAGAILNIGEKSKAHPAAGQSPLNERLAALELDAGAGASIITAALGADGTPPLLLGGPRDPMAPGWGERYDSWESAVNDATDRYRAQVRDAGVTENSDLEDMARELADINGELLLGQYGADVIAASNDDDENAAKQDAINVVTDYLGLGLGFIGPNSATTATVLNTHAESALLEAWFPTGTASGVFDRTVASEVPALLVAQKVQVVEAAATSGAVELPESLVDPATGGLRAPTSEADGAQFAEDLDGFIQANPELLAAVDAASGNLIERVNALGTGNYRGGS